VLTQQRVGQLQKQQKNMLTL